MNPALAARLAERLEALRTRDLYRVRRVVDGAHGVTMTVDGRSCLNFCSNDYLGLAADPRVAEAARAALLRSGTGSGASALICGYNVEHRALEEAVAAFLGRERALLFTSGWAANVGTLRAMLGKGDVLIADALNHASLIDGGRLSGAEYRIVPHRDQPAFEAALQADRGRFRAVVSDAVFSMDGDVADLEWLAQRCREQDATLIVDDAHGFGVLGSTGRGALQWAAERSGATLPLADLQIATLGKSLGASGAFVAGDEAAIEYLIQRARSWVFSTAPPPAIAAAARRALEILIAEPDRRRHLLALIERFRSGAAQRGLPVGVPGVTRDSDPATPIQALVLGAETRALAVSRQLLDRGFWVAAIRPPTVPAGTARLRITLTAAHEAHQVDALLDALAESLHTLDAVA